MKKGQKTYSIVLQHFVTQYFGVINFQGQKNSIRYFLDISIKGTTALVGVSEWLIILVTDKMEQTLANLKQPLLAYPSHWTVVI